MAKLTQKKLPASTLMEVLIAMVIIMVVFVISIRIFNNVLGTSISLEKLKIQNQLNLLSKEVKRSGEIPELSLMIDSVSYEYQAEPSKVENILRLEIRASKYGKFVAKTRCLVKMRTANEKD